MRRLMLALALTATLIAVYFAPKDDSSVVEAAKHAVNSDPKVTVTTGPRLRQVGFSNELKIYPRQEDVDLGNVFASHSWTPPPKVVVKSPEQDEPPAAPQAPPLPFHFMGRWVENGKTVFFLQFNDRNLTLSIGDTVDGTYSLDDINGGTLSFTYLPLKQKQTLVVGEVN